MSFAVILQVKKHRKDPQNIVINKQGFAFVLEEYIAQHPGEQIVVLFDLSGAGLAQLVNYAY